MMSLLLVMTVIVDVGDAASGSGGGRASGSGGGRGVGGAAARRARPISDQLFIVLCSSDFRARVARQVDVLSTRSRDQVRHTKSGQTRTSS